MPPACCQLLVWLTLRSWRWWWNILPKRAWKSTRLHGATSHRSENLVAIIVMVWLQNKNVYFFSSRTYFLFQFFTSLHITHCASNFEVLCRPCPQTREAESSTILNVHFSSGQPDLLTWNIHCKEHKRASCTDCLCSRVATAYTPRRRRTERAGFCITSLAVQEGWRVPVTYLVTQISACQTLRISLTASWKRCSHSVTSGLSVMKVTLFRATQCRFISVRSVMLLPHLPADT
jgi:hypothetical protein